MQEEIEVHNVEHKEMNVEKCYEIVKELHTKHPGVFMSPDEWLEKNECD